MAGSGNGTGGGVAGAAVGEDFTADPIFFKLLKVRVMKLAWVNAVMGLVR